MQMELKQDDVVLRILNEDHTLTLRGITVDDDSGDPTRLQLWAEDRLILDCDLDAAYVVQEMLGALMILLDGRSLVG
jgi:hypothetical protein